MAVSPKAQGKGVGLLLAQSAIKWAADKGASKIYLESNTKLKPAIKLYEKLGFKEITGISSSYDRVDIQMLLNINF
ncbi:N-acetyltransferase GCN5 [Flavobacterium anhuiense]|uniref:N-acetyltransferase GCN5 n=2 Tax=Flavobacterium anhuiense TaxID=459526 RepID=A0A444VVL2_9FLAO|nr:N-acetyltransferase GCN5 [Flavobacterium anhuiense]